MKINWLIILLLFLGLTAFNLSTTFDGNTPSVKVDKRFDENSISTGDVVLFTISICSAYNLETFTIAPDFLGDENSVLTYTFSSNTKQASVNYYYTIPNNADKDYVNFEFLLKDYTGLTKKTDKILVN